MADLATLQKQLTEAEAALHSLMMGQQVVEIRVNGRFIRKTEADKGSLKSYVSDLKAQINRLEGGSSPRSPIGFHA